MDTSKKLAVKVALAYLIVAGCWIMFSDELLAKLVGNPDELVHYSIIKGWGFVILTAAALYLGLQFLLRRATASTTHRKLAESALEERDGQYRRVVEFSPNGIFILQANRFVLANPAAQKIFGARSEPELLGRDVFDFIHPDFHEIIRRRIAQAAQQEEPLPLLEEKFLKLDGTAIEVESRSARFQFQGRPALLVEARDITERKRTQAQMSLQFSGLTAAANAIVISDAAGKIEWVNPAFTKLTGYTAEEAIGQNPRILKSGQHPPQFYAAMWQTIMAGNVWRGEMVNKRKDGSSYTEELTITPVPGADGKPAHFVAIKQDITEHKRAEAGLRRLQRQHFLILNSVAEGVHGIDLEGRIMFENPSSAKMLGWSPAELLGKTAHAIIHHSHADGTTHCREDCKIYATMRDGVTRQVSDEVFWRKDGTSFPVEYLAAPMHDEHGKIIGAVVTFADITERKRAEAELRESQSLYFSLVDKMPAGIFRKDAAGRYVFVNPWFCQLKGYKLEAMLGKTPRELAGEDSPAPASADEFRAMEIKLAVGGEEHHQFIMQTGRMIEAEEEYPSPDGSTRHLHVIKVPIFDAEGKVAGSQGMLFDITERKHAEELVRQSQERYRTLIETARDAIFTIAADGTFSSLNPAVESIAGISRADWISKPFDMMVHPDDLPLAREMFTRVLAGEQVPVFELRGHPALPRAAHLEMTLVAQADANGKIIGVLGIGRDITDRRKLEAQLRQSQKMEAIGQLASGVAHDFNNILAVIQLQAGLLKAEAILTADQLEYAGEIEKAAQRAANLTRQLLLFSRQQTLQPRDLNLNDAITNITKMLQRILGEDVSMQFKFSPTPLLLHADAGMLDQILLNLTVNARDAMPHGGQLIVETSAVDFDELARTHSPQARPGSFVCLSVSDSGCGIPPEILPKIFDPFFTTKQVGKGTGLGLATVFGIVQQHQGWINVYSEVGKGTTFRIYLPRLARAADKKAGWASLASVRGGSETILFVEDEPALRSSVRIALSRLGYRVLEATSGAEAVKVWGENRDTIQLVLTDMIMPGGMTGKELAQQLVAENPKLKVIYASGYSADIASQDLALQEGVNFLTKPFEAHKLAQTVRNCLDAAPTAG